MTKIITRYFESASAARAARFELIYRRNVSPRIVGLYSEADGLAAKLTAARVDGATAQVYQTRMANGGAVLLVKAGYKPLGVAKTTRMVAAEMGAVDMDGLNEEVVVDYERRPLLSVLTDHPHMLTRDRDPESDNFHMANWPIPLISRRKPFTATMFPRHARMADKPVDLLLPHDVRYGDKPIGLLVPGHKYMAKFPFDHLVPGHMFMAKFPFAHIVPGHKFMAKFPFAHIVPGHKYMAKFPFAHIVPGHKHMAKFPFGHIVPGHKYMANWILPHTKTKAA